MSSTTVKTVFTPSAGATADTRRFQVVNGAARPYDALIAFIKSTYAVAHRLAADSKIITTYIDDDADECSISTDDELHEAMRVANAMGKPLKVNVAFVDAPAAITAGSRASSVGVESVKDVDSDSEYVKVNESDDVAETELSVPAPMPAVPTDVTPLSLDAASETVNEEKSAAPAESPTDHQPVAPSPPSISSSAVTVEDVSDDEEEKEDVAAPAAVEEVKEASPAPDTHVPSTTWKCPNCSREYFRAAAYHIRLHQSQCRPASAEAIKVSSHRHPLYRVEQPYGHGAYFCNMCGRPGRGPSYQCSDCEYDLCDECLPLYKDGSTIQQLTWEWKAPNGEWIAYDEMSCRRITAAKQANKQIVIIQLGHRRFLVDIAHSYVADARTGDKYDVRSRVAEAPKQVSENGEFIHSGIVCDQCQVSPIVGVRFKCTHVECPDFDLCAQCEQTGRHPTEHILAKIRAPVQPQDAQRLFARAVGWQHGRRGHCGRFQDADDQSGPRFLFRHYGHHAAAGPHVHGHGHWGNGHGHGHGHGHGFYGPGGASRPTIANSTELPRAAFVAPADAADLTIVVKPGSVYTKTWSLKNVGNSAWPEGTKLVFLGGSVSFKGSSAESDSIAVPAAPAGNIVHLSIDVVVPPDAGRYRGTFRLQTASGYRFGPRIWLDFTADNETQAKVAEAKGNASLLDSVVLEQKYQDESKAAEPVPVPSPATPTAPSAPALPVSRPNSHVAVNGQPVNGGYIYSQQLSQLAAMGFNIDADVANLLEKYDGNVDKVVHQLVN